MTTNHHVGVARARDQDLARYVADNAEPYDVGEAVPESEVADAFDIPKSAVAAVLSRDPGVTVHYDTDAPDSADTRYYASD